MNCPRHALFFPLPQVVAETHSKHPVSKDLSGKEPELEHTELSDFILSQKSLEMKRTKSIMTVKKCFNKGTIVLGYELYSSSIYLWELWKNPSFLTNLWTVEMKHSHGSWMFHSICVFLGVNFTLSRQFNNTLGHDRLLPHPVYVYSSSCSLCNVALQFYTIRLFEQKETFNHNMLHTAFTIQHLKLLSLKFWRNQSLF